jgi:N6-L-threonylcarbamoyladenine synthase
MIILGFETTCDETGIALIEFKEKKFRILDHKLRSQFEVHKKYGGIVPILAAREHNKNLPILFNEIYIKNLVNLDIDYLAFSVGPGLPPSLLSGKNFVVNLAQKLNKKIIPINHLIAHFYSVLIEKNKLNIWQTIKNNIKFPALGLLISGGHTILVYFESLKNIKKLGETLDDALGESLDKSARILGLDYPGGPLLEKLAKKGKPIFNMPKPLISSADYNFSFSGIKTYFWQLVEEIKKYNKLDEETKANLAYSYQKTVFETVLIKTKKAYERFKPKSIIVTGGVAANSYLRRIFLKYFGKDKVFFPQKSLATDNGINIAFTAYFFTDKSISYEKLDIFPDLKI